jgi:hypothetical protein
VIANPAKFTCVYRGFSELEKLSEPITDKNSGYEIEWGRSGFEY